jgi:glutamate-1-semialdehyde 2,1-aminomutase
MNLLAPTGPVYQAGTLSGNPLAVAAGIKTISLLARRGTYRVLDAKGKRLADGFSRVIANRGVRATINRFGSMSTLFFGVDCVADPDQARACDREKFARFFHGMLKRGVYLPPAPFEAMFVSLAHSTADLDRTIVAFDDWVSEETVG